MLDWESHSIYSLTEPGMRIGQGSRQRFYPGSNLHVVDKDKAPADKVLSVPFHFYIIHSHGAFPYAFLYNAGCAPNLRTRHALDTDDSRLWLDVLGMDPLPRIRKEAMVSAAYKYFLGELNRNQIGSFCTDKANHFSTLYLPRCCI